MQSVPLMKVIYTQILSGLQTIITILWFICDNPSKHVHFSVFSVFTSVCSVIEN